MRFQRLVAQVNSPFGKMDYARTSGDHRLSVHRRRQHGDYGKGPKRTCATVKHETAPHRVSARPQLQSRQRIERVRVGDRKSIPASEVKLHLSETKGSLC